MQAPSQEHWEAALRLVRYLKGSLDQGSLLSFDSNLSLKGWCDFDWASCHVSCYLVILRSLGRHRSNISSEDHQPKLNIMQWLTYITCELIWLKGLLLSLGVHHPKAIHLFCDSLSAIHIAQNQVQHERIKYIEVDCHFVLDTLKDRLIDISDIHTIDQLTDIFTKTLGKK